MNNNNCDFDEKYGRIDYDKYKETNMISIDCINYINTFMKDLNVDLRKSEHRDREVWQKILHTRIIGYEDVDNILS